MATGLLTDRRFLDHVEPQGHPERADRLTAIEAAIERSGLKTIPSPARLATRAELELAHAATYLDALEAELKKGSGYLDPDTFYSEGTWTAALLAAGGTVDLLRKIDSGELDNGMAVVRPPGHHATHDRSMGFCLINNAAVAAADARSRGKRVAIVDWDVHHGNGTEDIFAEDPDVLYVSTHEWPQYPGTGPREFRGRGRGVGATVNIPLPAGTDDRAFLAAYDAEARPVLEKFAPDLVIVSAGYDAHTLDPLGGLMVTEASYEAITRHLLSIQPKTLILLEGGYNLSALGSSSVAVLRILCGRP